MAAGRFETVCKGKVDMHDCMATTFSKADYCSLLCDEELSGRARHGTTYDTNWRVSDIWSLALYSAVAS